MKKIISMILCLALLFCIACAGAEAAQKVKIGTVSINGDFTLQCGLPEGYTPIPVLVSPSQVIAMIRSEDPAAPVMHLSVAYDEQYCDVDRLNDLDPEAITQLEQTFIDNDPTVEITYGETGYGTLLLIARHESDNVDFIDFFSIYKGYCVEFVLAPSPDAEDKNLTENQLRLSIDFLTDLDFIPADEPVITAKMLGGQTLIADLTNYNAEANTMKAEIKRPIRLEREIVDALQVGDTLTIGQDAVVVETLEKDEFGVTVNEDINLTYGEEDVGVSQYEHNFMYTVATLTLELPENLSFKDYIDPESGEMLDEPTEHTAAEFAEMLAAGGSPDFASDNTYVTFDEEGNLTEINRYYTPWQ